LRSPHCWRWLAGEEGRPPDAGGGVISPTDGGSGAAADGGSGTDTDGGVILGEDGGAVDGGSSCIPPATAWTNPSQRDPSQIPLVDVAGGRILVLRNTEVWSLPTMGGPTSWTRVETAGEPPPWKVAVAAVFDTSNQRVIAFVSPSEVWALTLPAAGTPTWSKLTIAGAAPSFSSVQAFYDAPAQRLLVYAGFYNLWSLSLPSTGSSAWSQLAPTSVTAPASALRVQLDSANRRLLGIDGSGGLWVLPLANDAGVWQSVATAGAAPGSIDQLLADGTGSALFAYSHPASVSVLSLPLSATPTWMALSPGGPGPTTSLTAALDATQNRLVVFEGFAGLDPHETWSLSLASPTSWQLLIPSPGSLRSDHSAVRDPDGVRAIVFGGAIGTDLQNDTWLLSLVPGEEAWTLAQTSGTPNGRTRHSAIWDDVGKRMIVFGGRTASGETDEVWALDTSGEDLTWSLLSPTGPGPSPRAGHSAVVDVARGRMLIYGGASGRTTFADAWALSLDVGAEAWSPITWGPGQVPGQSVGHAAAYDAAHQRMVLWNGALFSLSLPDSGAASWSPLAAAGATPLTISAWTYDLDRNRLFVQDSHDSLAGSPAFFRADLYELDLSSLGNEAWRPRPGPGFYGSNALVVDPAVPRLLSIFGFSLFNPPRTPLVELLLGDCP
jgi:hypothetical protein